MARLLLIYFVLIGTSTTLFSQNFKADLEKMQEVYSSANEFYAKINVKAYTDGINGKPAIEKKAIIKKSGKRYLYTLDQITMLMNNEYLIMVNNDEKVIIFEEIEEAEQPSVNQIVAPNLDSILSEYKSVEYKGVVSGDKHYVVQNEKGPIDKVELFFDVNTFFLEKIIYRYNQSVLKQKGLTVITFSAISTKPKFKAETFAATQFFRKIKNTYEPGLSYKDFEVINTSEFEEQE